jgi:hydroxymethylglutaryl-CoA lyase
MKLTRADIKIFEMGLRDGLQNESLPVSFEQRQFLLEGLERAGLREIELGAFVRPDRVPQMADSAKLFEWAHAKSDFVSKVSTSQAQGPRAHSAAKRRGSRYWALVPNAQGLERAEASGANAISLFMAATETFNQKNIQMSVADSLAVAKTLMPQMKAKKFVSRAYLSTAFGCPFEGKVGPSKVLSLIEKLLKLEVEMISIGDTIGVASPRDVEAVIKPALKLFSPKKRENLAVHFHDTRGGALANCLRSFDLGVTSFDSSVGGLGGCPFAPGATGNVATEDLVYMFNKMGLKTGVDLDLLCEVSSEFSKQIGRGLSSRYLIAHLASAAR